MALNIVTDKSFDEALEWISKKENRTKSDVIRELVLEKFHEKRMGFIFGSLKNIVKGKIHSQSIMSELKAMDDDHDLD